MAITKKKEYIHSKEVAIPQLQPINVMGNAGSTVGKRNQNLDFMLNILIFNYCQWIKHFFEFYAISTKHAHELSISDLTQSKKGQ